MLLMIVYLFCCFVALGLGVLAAWTDFKGMTIPNIISVAVLALFFGAYYAADAAGVDIFGSLKDHAIVAGLAFVITFVMFVAKVFGGGDAKLVTAYSLWVGSKGIMAFVFYMSLAGALLGVVAIVLSKKKPFKNMEEGSWIARLQSGESVLPYGISIAIGVVAAFLYMGIFSPEKISLFLISK